MRTGLITRLMLSEDYVVHVLGYERRTLNEGRYNMALQQEILEEHLIYENMLTESMDWIKSNIKGGADWLKDKGNEAVDAIKEYGTNTKGVVMAITSMIKDPEAIKKYLTNIKSEIGDMKMGIQAPLNRIAMFFHEREMPDLGNMIEKLANSFNSLINSFMTSGWKGVMAGMSIGLLFRKLNEEFGITDKLDTAADIVSDPLEAAKGFFKDYWNAESEEGEEKSYAEQIKDFFSGEIESGVEELIKNSDFLSAIKDWILEKLGIIEAIKEKLLGFVKGAASKAIESFAGPIAWVKDMVAIFKSSKWVIDNLANYLKEYTFPAMLQRPS